jgi:hypothetical protein
METPQPPTPARKTLFLGLDGVMHHSKSKVAGFLSCLPMLEDALGTAEVDIVVLSSWDFASDFSLLKAAFPPSLRSRVVGRTTEELGSLHKRLKEIQNWLRTVPSPDWRVLDSDPYDYPDPCAELIRCSPHLGMGPAQAQAVRQWILAPAPIVVKKVVPEAEGPAGQAMPTGATDLPTPAGASGPASPVQPPSR